jgi:hypothetical protein
MEAGEFKEFDTIPGQFVADALIGIEKRRGKYTSEQEARDKWAFDIRQKVADCEESQWMPIAKATAITNERIGLVAFAIFPPVIFFITGIILVWGWERFGKPLWRAALADVTDRLPVHLRRGLTRLYLVVAVPWIAWFVYEFYDAGSHHSWSWHYTSHAFWSMLTVPIGGPILVLLIAWVLADFRKQATVMDALVRLAYGSSPPTKTANLQEAIELSNETLLGKAVDIAEVRTIAAQLYNGPMPYSTHDLAVATSLNLFKSAKGARRERFKDIQILARMVVLGWVKEKKVTQMLAWAFEETLYEMYKPRI